MVQDGKLSADDGAELIDAFLSADTGGEPASEGRQEGGPPPPPADAQAQIKDPFKSMIDAIEKLGREATESVNWTEVSKQVRTFSKKGLEGLKVGVEQIKKGDLGWPWQVAQEVKEITLPLPIADGKSLRVENARGNVRIVGGFDEGAVIAKAKVRGTDAEEARIKAEEYTLIVEESDNQVLIRQPDVGGLTVDLEIQVAGKVSVSVHTEAGDVGVLDTGGGCRVNSRSGDVTLRGLEGAIEVVSQSGDLSVSDCKAKGLVLENKSGDLMLKDIKGDINARTGSGDVCLSGCAGRSVSVETVSGDVSADLPEAVTGTLNVRTVNGSVELGIADGSDCRVSLSTLRGTVTCEVELADEARSEGRITGALGDGGGTLDASAVSGNIALRLRDSGKDCGE